MCHIPVLTGKTETDFKIDGTIQKAKLVQPSGGSLISHCSAWGVPKDFMDTSCTILTASKCSMLISLVLKCVKPHVIRWWASRYNAILICCGSNTLALLHRLILKELFNFWEYCPCCFVHLTKGKYYFVMSLLSSFHDYDYACVYGCAPDWKSLESYWAGWWCQWDRGQQRESGLRHAVCGSLQEGCGQQLKRVRGL